MKLPQSCEELLGRMVSFDTVNSRYAGRPSGEASLALWLEELGLAWGLACQRYPVADHAFNLLLSHAPNPAGEWLLLDSHLDTVGVTGMVVPPFALSVSGQQLRGRGVCDTKGSGAAMLWALRRVQQSRSSRCNIGVLFTVDEEAGMTGAATFARSTLPRWPGALRGIIVGEPTELHPVAAHNGIVRWTTVTHGVAAHSSNPADGRSAITDMMRVVAELENKYVPVVAAREHPLTGAAACSINVIRGGTQVNVIPDRCEIEIDRRIIPGESAVNVLAERDQTLRSLYTDNTGLRLEHLPPYIVPPLAPEPNLSFLRKISSILSEQGIDPSPRGARYVTNASHYATAGVPAIVLGPGNIAQAHTVDEWLAREQLEHAVDVYVGLMEN